MSTEIGGVRPVVLVADDNPDNRAIFTAILDHLGFRTITASGGREAVEMARRDRPCFIVMDLMMPDIDGDEALRSMRADPACPDVPVLAVTAQTLYSPSRAKADGFCGVVHKPVSPRHLADAVQRCLGDANVGLRWTDLPSYDPAYTKSGKRLGTQSNREAEQQRNGGVSSATLPLRYSA